MAGAVDWWVKEEVMRKAEKLQREQQLLDEHAAWLSHHRTTS